ncbi:hypothetical protein A1O3_06200 [Capronia epimyces CBS 606.96]|uniref:Sugar phosphate transporter domain-containing protein n=1 Tax=Capronia epimyces CBS 606.96 TaxID=1182542 RepID=W9XPE4_9EURO|nr:uncharacterized protein A1O3_06200 [Capronia epimyces CBS 606.96]EXJ82387.1 hypothetical protein A1O3_06200 [Capronia epimyces CBS 606.96]
MQQQKQQQHDVEKQAGLEAASASGPGTGTGTTEQDRDHDHDQPAPRWATGEKSRPRSNWKLPSVKIKIRDHISEQDVVNFLCVLLNTASTVCIVFANKVIFTDPQFRQFQVGTAAWHFFATTLLLFAASRKPFSVFPAVRLPLKEVFPISVLFVGFLLFGNLSLALNDVSVYQLAKIMTTPTVVAVNFVLFRKRISAALLAAIVVSCLGVALTNMATGAVTSNPVGTYVAIVAFVTTAFYQIWIGKKVQDLDVTGPQLLLNQAPISVGLLLLLCPLTDTMPDLRSVEPAILATFVLSGVLAAGLNLSQFLIIGRTSAVTFNVVSNAKNVIIIVLGWYTVHRAPSWLDFMGVSLALGGAAAYSWLRK